MLCSLYRLCIASFEPKLWKKADLAMLATKRKDDFEPAKPSPIFPCAWDSSSALTFFEQSYLP
jgi:hypothetical protein